MDVLIHLCTLSPIIIATFYYIQLIIATLHSIYQLSNVIHKKNIETMEYHIMFIRLIETIFCYDCMILNYISSKLSALKYPHHIFYRVYKIMIGYAVVFRYTFMCSRSSKLHQIARLQIRDSFL